MITIFLFAFIFQVGFTFGILACNDYREGHTKLANNCCFLFMLPWSLLAVLFGKVEVIDSEEK